MLVVDLQSDRGLKLNSRILFQLSNQNADPIKENNKRMMSRIQKLQKSNEGGVMNDWARMQGGE